jgi:hypothetical protein
VARPGLDDLTVRLVQQERCEGCGLIQTAGPDEDAGMGRDAHQTRQHLGRHAVGGGTVDYAIQPAPIARFKKKESKRSVYIPIYGPDGKIVKSVVVKNATDEPEDRTKEDRKLFG